MSGQKQLTKGKLPNVKVPLLRDTTCHLRRAIRQLLWVAPHMPSSSHNRFLSNMSAHLDSCQLLMEDSNASLSSTA